MVFQNNPAVATVAATTPAPPRKSAPAAKPAQPGRPNDPLAGSLESVALPGQEKLPPEFDNGKPGGQTQSNTNKDTPFQQAGQSREEVSQSAEVYEAHQALSQTETRAAQEQAEQTEAALVNENLESLRNRLAELEKQKTPEARREYRRLVAEISEQEIAEANKQAQKDREKSAAQQKEWEDQRVDQAVRDLLGSNLEFLNPQRKSNPHAQLVQLPGWAATRQGKALSQLQQAMDERLSRDERL